MVPGNIHLHLQAAPAQGAGQAFQLVTQDPEQVLPGGLIDRDRRSPARGDAGIIVADKQFQIGGHVFREGGRTVHAGMFSSGRINDNENFFIGHRGFPERLKAHSIMGC